LPGRTPTNEKGEDRRATAMDKPETLADYTKWLETERGVTISEQRRTHYEAATLSAKAELEESPLWMNLLSSLGEFNDGYLIKTSYPMLISSAPPILLIKPYGSFFAKTFRKNVLLNENWPDAPTGGWIVPSNWLSRINDVLRTSLVVKYLDAVKILADNILLLASQQRVEGRLDLEASDEGYYAGHVYLTRPFEVPRLDWDTEKVAISVEVQITTQLQDVIRKLTHRYYEERRGKTEATSERWQWEFESVEFIPNYLGHILHFLEGMIMEVRERNGRMAK